MQDFTPISGLVGGVLIGFACALLMLLNGRKAGVSGVFAGLLPPNRSDRDRRVSFPCRSIAAPLLGAIARFSLPRPTLPADLRPAVVSGLLVGLGTRMSGGCTSGHGVRGTARLSSRSLAATAAFMATAIATVAIVRHVIGA